MQKLKKQNNYTPIRENKVFSSIPEAEETPNAHNGKTILPSISVGLYGFAIVMTLIILTKLLAFSIGTKEIFELNINDVLFSFWGFLILSFARFVTYYKK